MSETIAYESAHLGILPLAGAVNAVVGVTAVALTKPTTARFLVLRADKGGFRLRRGDVVADMPAAEFPTTAVTNGSAGWHVAEGQTLTLPDTVSAVTVKGYAATSVLTYYWV
jgi:hypothetical protein